MEEGDIVHLSSSVVQLSNEDVDNVALTLFLVKFWHSLAILLRLILVLVLVEEVGVEVLEEELKMKLLRVMTAWVPPEVYLQLEEEQKRKMLERRHCGDHCRTSQVPLF